MGYRGDRRPIPDSNGRSLDDVRSRLSGLHFAKEQLSDGEAEILFLAECLLRYIDADEPTEREQAEREWPCPCGDPVFPWPDPYLPKFGLPLVYEDHAWRAVIRWWHRLRRYHRDPWTNERVPSVSGPAGGSNGTS